MSDGTGGSPSRGPSLRIVARTKSPVEIIGKGEAAGFVDNDEFWDAGACFSNADRARIRLSIHGLPLVRESRPASQSSYEQAWPSLPGKSAEQGGRSIGARSESEEERWARAVQPNCRLGDCGKWPTLQENVSGTEARKGRGRISSKEDGDYGNGGRGGGGGLHILHQRGHILSTQGPTEQQQAAGRGGICEKWERNTSRRWMRLPPIVMPDSNDKENCNPAQKRSRQAAFVKSNSSSSSSSSGASSSVIAHQPHVEQRPDSPPVLLMLNTDFIVTSSLEENLLLTLALSQKRGPECDELGEAGGAGGGSGKRRRQVLVGRFEAFSSFVRFGLGRDAKRVATECNAGGTSTISESLSVEYFARRFQAKDVVTEMEVEYCSMNWKKVDYICNLYGQRVGVSVTRAMSYPNPQDFSAQMAYRLLYKKLFGLVVARHGVTERHCFSQCILHVWCETRATAKILEAQYKDVSEELEITDDVIMVLTVAEGWHARPIFYESCLDRT